MKINPNRPVEELVGINRFAVRRRLGNVHCGLPTRDQMRACRPKQMRSIPVALRRGWVKCCLETIKENQSLYFYVQTGGRYGS